MEQLEFSFMKPCSPDPYTYVVSYEPDDRAFVGRVHEFPSLAAHGSTAVEALVEIQAVVADVLRVDSLRSEVDRMKEAREKARDLVVEAVKAEPLSVPDLVKRLSAFVVSRRAFAWRRDARALSGRSAGREQNDAAADAGCRGGA